MTPKFINLGKTLALFPELLSIVYKMYEQFLCVDSLFSQFGLFIIFVLWDSILVVL